MSGESASPPCGGRRRAADALVRGSALLGVALLGIVWTASAASAAEPIPLDGHLTDQADVLTAAEEADLEGRLAELAQTEGLPELYVMFVDRFDSPSDGPGWVDRVAQDEFLGQNQYLLAIATQQRGMAMSYGDDGPLSAKRVDEIQDAIASEHLAHDEWAEAVELAIDEFEHRPMPWWAWLLIIAGGVVAIVAVVAAIGWARGALARRRELSHLDGQKDRAARELVRADAAVRASAQELDFVIAEFGEETTAEFTSALDDARAKLTTAFERQRLLEDAEPDTIEDTRRWTDEILETCTAIHRQLREKKDALASLRDLVGNARPSLERLRDERRRADDVLAEAERRLGTLAAAYPAADVALVADAPAEMRQHLSAADAALASLATDVDSRRGGAITRSIRTAEQELAEVSELREDIEERARVLSQRGAAPGVSPVLAVAREGDASGQGAGVPGREGDARPDGAADPARERAERLIRRARDVVSSIERDYPHRSPGTDRRLQLAREAIDAAEASRSAGPSAMETHARQALERAEFARSFQNPRPTSYGRDAARHVSSTPDGPSIGMAAFGGITGAVFGGVIGAQLGGAGVLLGILVGAVFGALSGAYGKGGSSGGSSSGWSSGGRSSSFRSSGGSHRSSSGGSHRSSSSGGGRSSSGRRF